MSNNLEKQGDGGGETMLCPVCGVENPANAEVCIDCNFTFGDDIAASGNNESQEPQEETAASNEAAEGHTICGGCGAELPIDDTSCFICGESSNALEEDISENADSTPEETVPEASPEATEGWDLGVVGGDDVSDEVDDDELSLDDDLQLDEEPEEEPEQVEEVPELGPNEFHCPSCSKAIPMGTSKCSNCWADIPDMIRCPQCEIAIPLASDACPECFSKLENGVLIAEPDILPVAEVDEFDEPDEDLMPQEDEETEEFFEEVTEVYGIECPFCRAIANASDDICPECGMPLIEEEEQPEIIRKEGLKYQKPERDWYRTIAFGLVLVLLLSAIIPFVIPLPNVDRPVVRIDGDFGDWEPITTHNDSLDVSNPNIDIIDYKMISDVYNIYFFIQVAGTAFGDSQGDTSRIFIDIDQDPSTGYSIMGIGADYQIRVFGHGGDVESSSCLQFDPSRAQNDFNGFESFCPSVPHTAETLDDNDKFEVRVALEDLGLEIAQPVTAVYYMGDTFGNRDFSDTPLCNVGSLLFVDQESRVGASGIISGSSANVLALTMTAIGNQFDIASVSIDNSTGTFPASMDDGDVQIVNLTTSATSRLSGDLVHEEAYPVNFDVPDTHVVVVGQGAYAYANSAPALIEIDGAFADWAGKGMTLSDSADDQTMKNNIDANGDTSLDMLEQTTAYENNNLNILVNSAGDMLAGMWVPEIEESYVDTQPTGTRTDDTSQPSSDYTYSEPQVDRTRAPDLQRPTTKPEKTGEGAVKVFIDSDNDITTGYIINGIGADYLVQAFGQEGQVTRTLIYSFTIGADQNLQDWTIITSTVPESASSGSSVEISVPVTAFGTAVNNNATAVIQLIDWNLNGDFSDLTAWDVFETGARKGIRSFDPDGGGIKGIVSLDDINPIPDASVIARNNFNQIAAYVTFESPQSFNNYFITLSSANYNNSIELYGVKDGKYNYREVIYPFDNKVQNAVKTDFSLTEDIPLVAPQNVQLSLNATDRAIQVNWTHGSDPESYRIFSTNSTTNYLDYPNRGRYYHFPVGNIAGTSTGYLHNASNDLVYNQTNYYIIQAKNGTDYNYSIETSILADFYPPEIVHSNITVDQYASFVPITADFIDGVGIENATLYYRRGSSAPFSQKAMAQKDGNFDTGNGNWSTFMPIEPDPNLYPYEYYIETDDGLYTSFWGGPGTPITFNAAAAPSDPYPIYGYVYWNSTPPTPVPNAAVDISWINKSLTTVLTQSVPLTNGLGQYSVDLMDYDSNSIVWANATFGTAYGYNVTQVMIPQNGGEHVDIYLEAPALNITKTAPALANAGEFITYTIGVNNSGNTTAYNVNITDVLPPEVIFISADPVESGNSGNRYYWNISSLEPGDYYWINITVQINSSVLVGSIITNNVNATWTGLIGGPIWDVVDAMANTTIGAAHIDISKWAPAYANSGELITYWINYTNDGTDWASNVVITETYPENVSFVSSIPVPDIGNNIWDIGFLAAGAVGSIQITVQVNDNATGILNNTVHITGFDLPGVLPLLDATAWAETIIDDPLMLITKEGPATANTGEIITYYLNYTNPSLTQTAYNVVITETYDTGVTFISSWPIPSVGTDTWFVGDLAPGASGEILVNVTIDALSGIINNTVILDFEDAQTEPQDQIDDWLITTILNSDMLINKTAPAIANTGEFIIYTIEYFNQGADTAVDVVITETYPIGVTFIGNVSLPVVPIVGNNVWLIGDVAPGTGGTITITLQVDSTTAGIITNWVDLSYNNSADIPQLVVSDSADTLIADPFMQITKTGPATANSGQDITYWLNYVNMGTGNATNVVITETYPAGVTFVSSIPAPDNPGTGNNTWSLGTLLPGESGAIQITVNINISTSGVIMNTVMLEYENDDILQPPIQIYDWLNTTVSNPLMNIVKSAPATASPGDIIQYSLFYENTGTDTAYNVVITETYPIGVTFISSIPVPDVGNNVWNIGNVPAGGNGTILINVQINTGVTGLLTNLANLSYEDAVGQATEIWDDADTQITWPVMEVQKSGPASSTAGATIEYIITYQNTGTDTAHNVTITETYPVDVVFVDANPMPDIGDNVWLIGDVLAGASGAIYINVTIDANATGLLVNNVTLDYETPSFVVQEPVYAEWTIFLSGPYMTIEKAAPPFANTGQQITYSLWYNNTGNQSAENVVITETYPAGVTFIGYTSVPFVPIVGNNVWIIPSLAAGAGGVITITVQIDDWVPIGTVLTNFVDVDYENTAGISLPTESDSASTTIVDPVMTITKTGPATANTGEVITYTITYFNGGTEAAENVWINETYDAGVSFVESWPIPPSVPNFAWNIGTVLPGTGGTILINVTVDATSGTIWNTIGMNYTDDNGEYQMEISDSWPTDIVNPSIAIDKHTSVPLEAAPGQTFTYWINVFNMGNDWAYDINVTETYPAFFTFVSAIPAPDFGNNVWIIPQIGPAPANEWIAITVTIDPLAIGLLTNYVNATYNNSVGIPQDVVDDWSNTTVVNCLIDLDKYVPATANTGEQITYWINFTNIGTDTAYNLWINETYPGGVTYIGAIPAPDFGNNIWFFPTLASGATASIQITVQVNAGLPIDTPLLNNVTAEYQNLGDMHLDTWAENTTVVIDPLMTVEKSGPNIAAPGEVIQYLIWYNNTGNDTAYNVVITENYPPEVTFLNANPVPDIGNNVWLMGNLAPGFVGIIYINVTVSPTASGLIVNTVFLESENNIGPVAIDVNSTQTLIEGPFIVIDKTGPASASDGEIITYTITYQNTGPNDAYNVWINETYPSEVTFISAVPVPDIGNYAWDIGTLAPGAGGVITIQVQVNVSGTSTVLINNATANYTTNPLDTWRHNWDTATTYVGGPLLEITKIAPVTANTGEIITYQIQITNVGNQTAENVIVTENYPAGVTFIFSFPMLPDNFGAGDNIWTLPDMWPGNTTTIWIDLLIDIGTFGILMNEVYVDYQNLVGMDWPTNWAWANTTIIDPDLSITKTGPAIVNTGEQFTYTITVTNNGNDIAYNVNVSDTIPIEVSFVSSLPMESGNVVNLYYWNIGTMNPGETVVIAITVLVTESNSGVSFTNTADVDYDSVIRAMPTESDSISTMVLNPELMITKLAPAVANTGQTITYTIWINNTGDDWAYNVQVNETYPVGATFVSSIPAPTFGNNIWNLLPIAPGGSRTIEITILIEEWASGTLVNYAAVNHENDAGTVQPELNDTASTTIIDPLMEITKIGPATAVTHGEIITYTINYENTGSDTAYNVIITETYPAGVTFIGSVPAPDIGNNIWLLGDILSLGIGQIIITVSVNPGASGFLVNDVELNYEDTMGLPQVTETAQNITAIIAPSLTVVKTAPPIANTGETITYTITITNIGNADADNVVVTEIYPIGVTFIGYVSVPPVPIVGNNIWNIGTMLPGEIVTITITLQVTASTGWLTNTVMVDYENTENFLYPTVQAIALTQVINPDVSIEKTAPAFANTGEQITYIIWVNNTGDDWAYNVWVNETYPANITFISAIPAPINPGTGNNTWNLGDLAGGASVQIIITVDVNLGLPINTMLVNNVVVDHLNGVSAAFQFTDDATTVIIDPLIVITKTGPAIAAPGEIIMYMITVENTGNDWAYDVRITEIYPPGTTFINSTYPPDVGNNIWILGNLPPGWFGTMFINLSVDAGVSGNITNFVVVDYVNFAFVDMIANANWTTLITGPYLSIQKTGPATATEGQDITYSIVVENTGDNNAYNVVVTETYPADVTFVSSLPVADVGNNVWNLGTMAPGDIVWINITVNVNAGANILINIVSVNYSSDIIGNVTTVNTDSVVTIVNNPWMDIIKTAPIFANWEETIMYTITYTNLGNASATNIWINETYPGDVTFVNASIVPTIGNGTWYIGTLAPGESGIIFINVTVDIYGPGILYNYVELTFDNPAGVVMPVRMAWANTAVINPFISIIKNGPSEVNPGEIFVYTIWVNNTGDDWAYNVVITDFYPLGVTFVSSIPLPDDIMTNNTWTIAALGPGASGMIQITMMVTALSGTLWNTVNATYNNTAVISQEPVWADVVTDIINPLMTVSKTAPATAVPGEFITYTIDYENTGTDWAYNVVITEFYPVGITFVSAVPAPTIGDNIWQIGAVAPGGTGSIDITVQVNNGTSGTLVNDVTLDYENRIGVLQPQEIASDSTDIEYPELAVEKVAPEFANTGELIIYTIWVNNTGTSSAINIVVTETYPVDVTYVTAAPLPDGGNNIWLIPLLLPGQSWFVNITVQVNLSASGNLINDVNVNYDDIIGQPYPEESDSNITQVIDPMMDIIKVGPASASSGEIITYWVNYTNLGLDTAYNVIIIENYPLDVTFIGAIPAPTFGNNFWDIGDVASGVTVPIEITVMVNNDASGTMNNTVTLDYENSVRTMPQETANLVTQILDPLMNINKTAPEYANPGEQITYTIAFENAGTGWAYNINITETYPPGILFVSAIPSPTYGDNVWIIPTMAPGASMSIQIIVDISLGAAGLLENLVNLEYENSARAMPSESATDTTEIISPVLSITKDAPATANPGETFTYTLTIENVGTDTAYNVRVVEFYPAGISYFNSIPLPDIGNNIWFIGDITPGSSAVIDITVIVDAGAYGVVLMNHATGYYTNSIDASQPEVHAFANTTIIGPIMEITKAATTYANVGELVTFWVNYTNTGTDTAYNVIITETYPAGMDFVSAIPAPDIGDNIWLIGTVAPGGGGTIQITVNVSGPASGQYENFVELDYQNAASMDYPTISATAITAVGNIPLMTITKVGPAQANAGESVVFNITYTNVGNVTALFVNITDTYPFGLEFDSSVPPPTFGDNFWVIGSVLAGDSFSILVTMNVTGDQYGILSNVINISYESSAGELFEETATWEIEIVDAFIELEKSAPLTAADGSTVTYTITYTNIGSDTAYNFTITEDYPQGSTFVSAIPVPTFGNFTWELGDLAAGASGTIVIDIILNAGPFIQINNVTATWNNTIDVTSWANATATTVIDNAPTAIMVVEKWATPTINPGGNITYIINYTNLGVGTAFNFWINETFPAGTAWNGSGVAPTIGDNWLIGDVPGNSNGTLFINVTVAPSVVPGTVLMNQADYDWVGAGTLASSVFANTTVVNPLVTITKTGPTVIYAGEIITYTITYQNTGNDTAYNLNITDTYPAGVNYSSSIPAPTYVDNILQPTITTWIIGAVPVGGSGTITVYCDVNGTLPSGTDITNYVWLNYTNTILTEMSDNVNVTTVVVDDIVNLEKTGPQTADPGETITYLITYSNEGASSGPVDIMITEFYDNVTFVSANPAPDIGDNIWIFMNVPAGGGGTIEIIVTVNATTTKDIITNRAMLNYTSGPIGIFLNATVSTVLNGPLMTITKTGPVYAVPGSTIMYTITYENIGAGYANNVTITESYPGFITFLNAIPAPNPGTNNVWTLGAIAPGDSGTITIFMDVSLFAYGTLTNWVQLTYHNNSGDQFQVWDNAITTIALPSMVIEKSGPAIVSSGQQITYTLTYTNLGLGLASNVIIEDAYPANLTYVSSSPSGFNMGGFIRWYIGNVPAGASVTIDVTFDLDALATGAFTNYAYLNYTDQSGTPYYRMDSLTSTIRDPVMNITMWAPTQVNSGEIFTFWINYSNVGSVIAYDAKIVDWYPAAITFISSNPPPTFSWALGTLAPGDGGSIEVTVQVGLGFNGTLQSFLANLTYNNSANEPMEPEYAPADVLVLDPLLSIVKTGPVTANTGETITYTINVTNLGGDLAQNIIITETYPIGLTFFSAVPSPDIGNNIWFIGDLDALDYILITITLVVNDGVSGIITNNVLANYTNEIGVYQNQIPASWPTNIIDPVLTVTKEVSTPLANTGDTIMYIINVTNTGTDIAYNVNVTDVYSLWTSFDDANPSPDFGNDIWLFATIAIGATETIFINVTVDTQSTIINWVYVNYEDVANEAQQQVSDSATTFVRDPFMEITKTANATAVIDGYILYTITYTNIGNGDADNVVITETYSPNVTFVGASVDPDNLGTGNDTWTIVGIVPSGTSVTIYVLVQVNNDTLIGEIIINDADLYYEDLSGNAFAVSDGAITTIIGPNMTLTKEAIANITYEDGITFDYYINYTNADDWAYNVVIMDELPLGVVYVTASPLPSFNNGSMYYWNFSTVAPSTFGVIRITVEIQSGAPVNLTNNVTLSYTNLVGWTSPDLFDQANTTITYLIFEDPAMEILKTGTSNANASQMLNYTLEYWNNGTGTAYNVIITETYPAGLIYWSSSVAPTSGNNTWYLGTILSGGYGWINITLLINSTLEGTITNNVSLDYENVLGSQMPTEYSEFVTVIFLPTGAPPEVITTPPEFVFAGQNFTLYASVIDHETGIDTVILYWIDIFGVQYNSTMSPLLIDTNGNGIYQLLIPSQVYKGFISYFVWVNDTEGNTNRTGIYDVPVRLPPYFIWGYIYSADGTSVSGGIIQITDMETNETVIAMTDGVGYYQVDLATLYSGYMNGEDISVFATDGLYYGTNASTIDLDFMSDNTMSWPNRQIDVVLSEIPEFTMILTPIIGILILVLFLRRNRRREEDEYEN